MKKILIIPLIFCGGLGSLYVPLSGEHAQALSLSQEVDSISREHINKPNKDGYTLLHKVIGRQFIEENEILTLVKRLIEKKADVNCRIPEGKCAAGVTPLYFAVFRSFQSVIKLLIQSGAQVNMVIDSDGWNPLILAADMGYKYTMMFLLDHQADIKAKFKNCFTVFHILANNGHDEALLALLARNDTHEHFNNETLDGIVQEALVIAQKKPTQFGGHYQDVITVLADDYPHARSKQRETEEEILQVLSTSPESGILPKDVVTKTIYPYLSFRDFMKRVPQLTQPPLALK